MADIVVPATLWRRLAASIYDGFLILAVWMLASFLVLPFTGGDAVPSGSAWYRIYLIIIGFIFFSGFWMRGGQTLGMRSWRMRLRRSNGDALTLTRCALRYIAAWPSWLLGIGVLWCLFDPMRRALHDIVAGTEIIVLPKDSDNGSGAGT